MLAAKNKLVILYCLMKLEKTKFSPTRPGAVFFPPHLLPFQERMSSTCDVSNPFSQESLQHLHLKITNYL